MKVIQFRLLFAVCLFAGILGNNSAEAQHSFPFFPIENDTLKTLVVYCNFPSPSGDFDTRDLNERYILTDFWPRERAQQLPQWADSVICPDTKNIWHPSMTGYFQQCSRGKFWLIGDVYPELYVFKNQVSYYANSNGKNIGWAVKELLENIDSKVDFSKYDKLDPFDYDKDSNKREQDGIVDFIFIVFRFTNSHTIDSDFGSYQGIASLGGYNGMFGDTERLALDGKVILPGYPGSGCISSQMNGFDFGINTHEFAQHYFFGAQHFDMGSWNISGGSIASADDRERLGWDDGKGIIPVSDTIVTLRDYVTEGDYVKIPLTNYTLFIEHRRRLNYYSSERWHNWKWLPEISVMPFQRDSGVFIYRKSNDFQFNVEHAGGRWDWRMCGSSYVITDTPYVNTFYKNYENPLKGENVMELVNKPAADFYCNHYEKRPVLSYIGSGGDENTCFDIGYNEVYSPYTNPAQPVFSSEDSLEIRLLRRDEKGNMVISIKKNKW